MEVGEQRLENSFRQLVRKEFSPQLQSFEVPISSEESAFVQYLQNETSSLRLLPLVVGLTHFHETSGFEIASFRRNDNI